MSSPTSATTSFLRDAKHFKSLSSSLEDGSDNDRIGSLSSAGVSFGTASELRVGKYCLIQGHPCRIRDIQRSAPGKHGHAKRRIIAVGIFDQRKRETIFSSHQQVWIPEVETRSNILGAISSSNSTNSTTDDDGSFEVVHASDEGLPSVLSGTDDNASNKNVTAERSNEDLANGEQRQFVLLTVTIACGYVRVAGHRPITQAEAAAMIRQNKQEQQNPYQDELMKTAAADKNTSSPSGVLSKKEQRKLKKAMTKKKAAAVAAVVD